MHTAVKLDHIEVHVEDIEAYGLFLQTLFAGGRFRQISDSGTSMFIAPDGTCVEVKRRKIDEPPHRSGFCLPCLRMDGARSHIEDTLGLEIGDIVENPEGQVYFFADSEGVEWHIKDYTHADRYVNW